MDEAHRQNLAQLHVEIIRELQHLEDIIDRLIADNILTPNQSQTILSAGPTRADKTRSFLENLVRCGPQAYSSFVSAVTATNQSKLTEKLASLDVGTRSQLLVHSTSRAPTNIQAIAFYPVESTPRGYVLLINVENFAVGCGLSTRSGSREDVDALYELFTDLGYSMEIVVDPDSKTLNSRLDAFFESPLHKNVDAGGLIFMTHGWQNYVYTADGNQHGVNEILARFSNNAFPALSGKPKFIIFQACRGDTKDTGSRYMSNIPLNQSEFSEFIDGDGGPMKHATWTCLPYMTDCVIAYSTLPGFVSWRCERKGSWFIQILVNVFREHAGSRHILDLLTEVNCRLVKESMKQPHKQVTQPANTLTRAFYLSTAHFERE